MPSTQQPTYAIMTLAQWMMKHHDNLDVVVAALCTIFDLPDQEIVKTYVEDEIDRQARLLLISDDRPTILGIAGWNWAHAEYPSPELPVYLGVQPSLDAPGLRLLLVETLLERLRLERTNSENLWITDALLQFPPQDRELRRVCLDLGYRRDLRRNESFNASLGANGYLRSMLAPIYQIL